MKVVVMVSLVGVCAFLVQCRSNPKAVNSNYSSPILPMGAVQPSEGMYVDSLPTAVSGTLLLKADVPRPLYRTRLALYKIDGTKKTLVSEFSTDENGAFKVSRALDRGVYELKVTDPRYQGSMSVSLLEKPARGVILEVSEAPAR